jgi:hypothetical protein
MRASQTRQLASEATISSLVLPAWPGAEATAFAFCSDGRRLTEALNRTPVGQDQNFFGIARPGRDRELRRGGCSLQSSVSTRHFLERRLVGNLANLGGAIVTPRGKFEAR